MTSHLTPDQFLPASERLELPDGSELNLQALSLPAALYLVVKHQALIGEIITAVASWPLAEGASISDCLPFLGETLKNASHLVGDVIATSAGIPDWGYHLATLPFATQLIALEAIMRLSLVGHPVREIVGVTVSTAQLATILANLITSELQP